MPSRLVESLRSHRVWWIVGAVVLAVVAGSIVWGATSSGSHDAAPVEVSRSTCGSGLPDVHAGLQAIRVANTDIAPVEVALVNPDNGAVYGEIDELAPQATRSMDVRIGDGVYALRCSSEGTPAVTGTKVKVAGSGVRSGPAAKAVTNNDLLGPTKAYALYVRAGLSRLVTNTAKLQKAVAGGNRAQAKKAWLTAHLQYERLGGAYGAFGDADAAINGTDAGLPNAASDPGFTGFHRLEKGLWRTEPASKLRPVAKRLLADVTKLSKSATALQIDQTDIGRRAHEIMENTLQFELTGRTDYGSGTNLATAQANLEGTKEVLKVLRPVLEPRMPTLPDIDRQIAQTDRVLTANRTKSLQKLPRDQRERVNAAVSELTELLAPVATVTEPRKTS